MTLIAEDTKSRRYIYTYRTKEGLVYKVTSEERSAMIKSHALSPREFDTLFNLIEFNLIETKEEKDDGFYPNALNKQVGGSHYQLKIQPIEFIHANKLDFIQGNIIKYIVRFREKNGREDLEKIKQYVDILLELEYEKK